MSKRNNGLLKALAGLGVGVGIGMLVSPKSGKENRKALKDTASKAVNKVKDIDPVEVKDEVLERIEELKKQVKELDKEKVMEIATDKANELKKMANDLVKYAKDKGTPVVEKMAEEAREKAISAIKEVLDKLEKNKD